MPASTIGWIRPPRDPAGPGTRRHHRWRGRRHQHRLSPGETRLAGRPPRGAGPADQRIDVPFRRTGGPAPLHSAADETDDGQRRPLWPAQGRDRDRHRMAAGWKPAARLIASADGRARAPGGLGHQFWSTARAGERRGSPPAIPAHGHRQRPRCRLPPQRWLPRPEWAGPRPGRGRAARRGAHP